MVRLQITPYQETERSQMWRFNSSLLQDVGFKEELRAQIRLYLETNVSIAPSTIVVWEAMKAFLMGFIIQYSSHKKKVNTAKLTDLEKRIKKPYQALPAGKSPGQDGFTAELFKCYAEDLLPLFYII